MEQSASTNELLSISELVSDSSVSNNGTGSQNDDYQIQQDALLAAKIAGEEAEHERDCASDAALAIVLQKQFDTDFNNQLKREEARLNGQSKVGVSLDRFKRNASFNTSVPDESLYESDDENIDRDSANLDTAWDIFERDEIKQKSRMVGKQGFVIDEEGNVITKHDIPTSSRKNMCRLMELKTDIQTGDAGGKKDDFRITNYVYNKLKVHSKKSSRRCSQRLFDKKERENERILEDIQSCKMSDATRAIMDGLQIAHKIETLNGVIGHGKESTVLHATGRDHEDLPEQEVAIKIFNSNSNVAFKTRDTYNKSKCPSYKFDKPKSKSDSLNKWAERGFKNLKLLRRENINCPDAISLKKHVLVMSFLGSNASPSPQLKDAHLDDTQLRNSYEQVVDIMCRMYKNCELIHGDLSEYNLLWHQDQVYVIDVSQSMFSSHPNANFFLYRDCENILDFYAKAGLTEILDAKSLYKLICDKDLHDKDVEFWAKIEDFPRNEKLMQRDENTNRKYGKSDCFETMLNSTGLKKEVPREEA